MATHIWRNIAVGVVAIASTALASYIFGFYRGKAAMDNFCGDLLSGTNASIRGETLPLLLQAAEIMTKPEEQTLRKDLLLQARTAAHAVKDCSASSLCVQLTGKPLPDAAVVEKAIAQR